MGNKKTIIGIIILLILILGIVVFAYSYNKFNSEQMKLLSEESNKILQSNIVTENVDFNIKTKKNYAIVEKAIKEYVIDNKENAYALPETGGSGNRWIYMLSGFVLVLVAGISLFYKHNKQNI